MSYTTLMRWHASYDAPLIETEWLLTDLPFIDGPILLGNRWVSDDQASVLRVGEAPTWESPRTDRGLLHVPPGLNGLHVCNPQYFATGQPWPVTGPDTIYNDDGWPVCCLAPTEEINGGSETGGEVTHDYSITHSPTGGSETGGVVLHDFGFTHATAGGSETGGEVVHDFGFSHAPEGGSETGGAVVHDFGFSEATAGGSETGGAVEHDYSITHATSGGSETGGEVVHDFGFSEATAGGSETGGAVLHDYTITHALAGGSETGGAVVHSYTIEHATSGGSETGGAVVHDFGFSEATAGGSETGGPVTHDYAPPQPTPGSSCSGAPTVNQSQTYSYSISAGFGVEQWFTFTLPSTGTWHVATTGLNISGPNMTPYSNGSCPLPNLLFPTTSGPPRWTWNGTAGDVIWLKFTPPFSGTAGYTFVWDSGA